jgi:excisionase family DNA binding protein
MTTADAGEELMTVAEVQRRLRIGRSKVYSIIANRSPPEVRKDRAVRMYKSDVERYLAENRY